MASLSDGPSFLQHSGEDESVSEIVEPILSSEPRKKRPIWVWVAVGAGVAICLGFGAFRLNALLHAGESDAYVTEAASEDERPAEDVEQTEDIGQTADAGQFDVETYEDDDGFGFSVSGSIPVQDDAASDDVADDYWKDYIASKYGDRYITDSSKLTMDNYQSEEAYLDTFRINDGDTVEDVTVGGVADGGLISQEFLDTAVKFMASVADEPSVEARVDARDAWLDNVAETMDFGPKLFFQWEGNMLAPVKYARQNVLYLMELPSDDPDIEEIVKDVLIMDLNTNRLLHYKQASSETVAAAN